MNRVVRNRARRDRDTGNDYRPAVTRNLPLVIPDQSELDQHAEVLLSGRTCPTPHSSVNAWPGVFSLNWPDGVLAVRRCPWTSQSVARFAVVALFLVM